MAIKVPPIGQVTTLWQHRASAAINEYKSGVQGAGQAWQSAVDESEDDWQNGVNMAAGNRAYSRGVGGKAALYVDKAVNLGATRYSSGIGAATGAYTTGMGKVLGIISGVNLPARVAVGGNNARSAAVADRLHQAKIQGEL